MKFYAYIPRADGSEPTGGSGRILFELKTVEGALKRARKILGDRFKLYGYTNFYDERTFKPYHLTKNPQKRKTFHLPFRVDTWFERDRASIIVSDAEDNEVFEAWDEDVGQLVEDGFIKSRDIKGSALDYAAYLLGFKDHYDMRVKVNRQYEMSGEDLKIGNVTIVGDEKEEEEE